MKPMLSEIKRYQISELLPVEAFPRYRSLEYFVKLCNLHGNLNILNKRKWNSKRDRFPNLHPPIVFSFENSQFLMNGNQRAIFYTLNRIDEIEAEELCSESFDYNPFASDYARVKKEGVSCFEDLAKKVERPERFLIGTE